MQRENSLPMYFQIPYSKNYLGATIAWSAQSDKIATEINGRDIFILDVQGRVIKEIHTTPPQGSAIKSLKWLSKNELQYTISRYTDAYRIDVD